MGSQKSQTRLAAAAAKSLQSCLTLCDPIAGSPPGSPVLGILQARTLEWVAVGSQREALRLWHADDTTLMAESDQIRSDQSLSRVRLFVTP